MNDHAQNKRQVMSFLTDVTSAAPDRLEEVVIRHCTSDVVWEVFHPFNTILGTEAGAEEFWRPLRVAFPDAEQRIGFAVSGTYEGHDWVSTLGHMMGTFDLPWLGIPPTHGLQYLRFGVNVMLREDRIAKVYMLLDIVDLMRQAGYYPLRSMPGSAEAWPTPPADSGATTQAHDPDLGARTLTIVREMQEGLGSGADLLDHASNVEHSPHWHDNMNWYGPAGIGSCRGQRGFDDYHGALFIQAFPDRTGYPRDERGPQDAPGHYIQIGDGRFAVTSGWPSLHATHTGGQWLGMPPTGRHITMRVADWYRTDAEGKLVDNWVMIDTLDMLDQMGYDVLDDLVYIVDPTTPRWPRVRRRGAR